MSDTHGNVPAELAQYDVSKMSPVVASGLEILRENPNPETLRELLALHREWEASEAQKAFSSALAEMKKELPSVIVKDKTVNFDRTHYTHASLANIISQVEGVLSSYGFSLSWETSSVKDMVSVTCFLKHCGGHHESTTLSAPPDQSGKKNPVQAIGSTVAYLQRYTATALLGITTADMPDADNRNGEVSGSNNGAAVNRRVAEVIVQRGLDLTEAVNFVGRDVHEWTPDDVDKLRGWVSRKEG